MGSAIEVLMVLVGFSLIAKWIDEQRGKRDEILEKVNRGSAETDGIHLYEGVTRKGGDVDHLKYIPELAVVVEKLRESVGIPTGNLGYVNEIAEMCRGFAKIAYRRLGREPGETSEVDVVQALGDMTKLRADITNAIQGLYIGLHKESRREAVDKAGNVIMRVTDAYIRAVASHCRIKHNEGLPSPWRDGIDQNYDMIV